MTAVAINPFVYDPFAGPDHLYKRYEAALALGFVTFPVTLYPTTDAEGNWDKGCDFHGLSWPQTELFTDPEVWHGKPHVAINCEASGVVVIDVDVKPWKDIDGFASLKAAGITLPRTPFVASTPTGGKHHYYRAGSIPIRTGSDVAGLRGVDVRAVGGLAFAPGNYIESGREYKLL